MADERRRGGERAETVQLTGTVYDRVLRTQQVAVHELAGGAHLIVPVTDRGDAIGVLELFLARYPDEQVVAKVAATAHALAYVVIANRRHTDLFEWGQRTTPFSLAAEIQRRQLPTSYTCEAGQFTLAGWLEPASTVGGDTFDYNLDRDVLQLSPDFLKLDRSLISRIDRDPQSRALCASLIDLGRALGLDVVAEGVETTAQLAALSGFGCGFAQGFVVGRPLPLSGFTALVAEGGSVLLPGLVGSR